MNNKTLYIHAGLSKTGTTYLQEIVFPLSDYYRYIVNPKTNVFEPRYPWDTALRSIFSRSPLAWDIVGDELLIDVFGNEVLDNDEPVLLSDEGLLTFVDPVLANIHMKKFKELCNNIGFASVKVLISIRRQDTRLASLYAQTSHRRYGASQNDFESWIKMITNRSVNWFSEGVGSNYWILYRLMVDVFGKENVLMVPYELMKDNAQNYLKIIYEYMNVDVEEINRINEVVNDKNISGPVNVRSVGDATWLLRDMRIEGVKPIRLRPRRLFDALGLPREIYLDHVDLVRKRKIVLTPELSGMVIEKYSESNRLLDESVKINLNKYGYY